MPLRTLSDLADTLMAQRLASVSGVGHVAVQGGIKPAVRIQADLSRLASYGLSMADLRTAIARRPMCPGPRARSTARTSPTPSPPTTRSPTPRPTRRSSSPTATTRQCCSRTSPRWWTAWRTPRSAAGSRTRPAVVLDVLRQPGANVIETVQRVKAELPRIEHSIPSGVKLTVVSDRTATITRLHPRRAVHPRAQRGPGGAGGALVPAHPARHHHRRHHPAGIADRHLRRDVVLRLLARQPVADGADDRHRLRGRRRHRHDREHRAPHGGGRAATRSGAQGRARDRLHGRYRSPCP